MSKKGGTTHYRKDRCREEQHRRNNDLKKEILYSPAYRQRRRKTKGQPKSFSSSPFVSVPSKKKEKTFGEIINLWIEQNRMRLKGGSIGKYQSLINAHIMPQLGKLRLSQLSASAINSYLNDKLSGGRVDKTGGLAPSYVNSIRVVINSVIRFAVSEQLMPPLKMELTKAALYKNHDLTIFSKEEQKKLEASLTAQLDQTKLGILISLHTGMRIGEICALSWNDIDLNEKVIHIRHTVARVLSDQISSNSSTKLIIDTPKTRSSKRDIPISSWLYPHISRVKSAARSPYVISDSETFVSPRTFEYRYHRVLTNCGVSSINYHALRHTFATRCIEAGVDVKSLSEILGHANVGITLNTYVHSSLELKRMQIEKLAAMPA